ncbi:hypothetical protein BOX15_Mlig029171g3 [Macrostomum lignano]|uniref:Uncharacterized protein n=1 Tax=Macrostomum lignano TaxID=282301 RepID=A0A267FW89_9PLAT|nr:hypothetical protein BOX15_Mlig029171g3 [Macrostomum lignano]
MATDSSTKTLRAIFFDGTGVINVAGPRRSRRPAQAGQSATVKGADATSWRRCRRCRIVPTGWRAAAPSAVTTIGQRRLGAGDDAAAAAAAAVATVGWRRLSAAASCCAVNREPQLRARPGRRRYPPSGATGSDNQQQQQQTVAVSSADSSSSGGVNGGGGCGSGFGYANARLPMHLLQSTDLLTQELQEHLAATGGNSLSPSLGPGLGRVCDSIAEREQRLAQLKLGNDNDVKIYLPLSNTTGPAILGGSSMCNRTAATAAAATAASDVAACLAASLAEGNDDSRDGESDSRLGYNRSASADPKSEDDLDLDVEVDVLHGDVDNEDEDYEGEFDATLSGHQQLDSEQTFRPNSSII